MSRCELVIDFLGQLFCVLNEILYSLLVSEFVNLVWQMNAQKQKGQALNAASAQKAIDILKVLLFLLICSGHFHLYPRWKGRDQISEPVLLDRYKCFPALMLFSFFARSVSHSLYGVYNPYISGCVLKNQVFLSWYYSIAY